MMGRFGTDLIQSLGEAVNMALSLALIVGAFMG